MGRDVVPGGGALGVQEERAQFFISRRLVIDGQQSAINQELSRLTRLYGYRQPNVTGQTAGGSFSTWRGFR